MPVERSALLGLLGPLLGSWGVAVARRRGPCQSSGRVVWVAHPVSGGGRRGAWRQPASQLGPINQTRRARSPALPPALHSSQHARITQDAVIEDGSAGHGPIQNARTSGAQAIVTAITIATNARAFVGQEACIVLSMGACALANESNSQSQNGESQPQCRLILSFYSLTPRCRSMESRTAG